MLNPTSTLRWVLAALVFAGCFDDSLTKANQQRIDQQQVELDQLRQQVSALQAQRPSSNYAPLPPGACDQNIMRAATRKGGERFASSDFGGALNYYQDALAACPNNPQAHLNLARTYEALGDRIQALTHYRIAANKDSGARDSETVRAAREALSRLGG